MDRVRAWHPDVPAVREVFHATFDSHAYPAHTHDTWTVLLIDEGAVSYALERSGHIAAPRSLTLLPPHVPHDGRSAVDGASFRKRVLYLDEDWLPSRSVSAAVSRPLVQDARAVAAVRAIHGALESPGDTLAAEGSILSLAELVLQHWGTATAGRTDAPLARRLRAMLDDRLTESFTLSEAARLLGAHPSHLVRSFSRAYGISPHRYVTGRRIDLARRLLLVGHPPARVAAEAGFHDQAHLTRHFRRVLGTTPGAFAA
ncbi:helix-turn-helix transcriptional regulator [Salinibacterium soli]|uniref:AraC family transcriptional regulator n=1 Tax=Antiquaquibacter soli TaxID=3064523 RepID=A0ABT9BTN4_9MICO|nr:AraC family transcriptional regulator [Protaetiibacter sp. WY-16]MDO7882760.1 AraC family transcriptional regulator [Protaetiibacter sp. WY-16]